MKTKSVPPFCAFWKYISIAILIFSSSVSASSQGKNLAKIHVNALYIYNFSNYVKWPNMGQLTEFRIGVIGNEPELVNELNIIAGKKKAKGLPIKVLAFKNANEVTACEILYVDAMGNPSVNLNNLLKKNTLLVSENNSNFNNTMITFIFENGWQKFAINEKNVSNAGLVASENLISLGITTQNDWKDAFGKFKYVLSHEDASNIKISKNDLAEVVHTQEKQLQEIGAQKQSIQEQIELLKTKEEQIKEQEQKADSLNTEIALKKQSLSKTQTEIEKQKATLSSQQKEITLQEIILNKQKLITAVFVTLSILILGLALLAYKNFRAKKRDNVVLEKQKVEITSQKKIIEVKNHEILDSITYAKRIQSAILPEITEIQKSIQNFFILYLPKDIVSGDFYYFNKTNEGSILAAADCTGHGVPGALMSLVGFKELKIANTQSNSPARILKLLNNSVKEALKQNNVNGTKDGMDIALIKLNGQTLTYSGANRPLWVCKKGSDTIDEIKATKQSIAGYTVDDQEFAEHRLDLEKEDMVYLFSDGYADQFGGDKVKKLTTKRFRDYLLTIKDQSMISQQNSLEIFIEKWRGQQEQIDDILVIGVRI